LPIELLLERRRAPRRTPTGDEPLCQVRLRAGRQLSVINLSDSGLLAHGEMRLLPGTHVDVHLVTPDGRVLIRSRVVRAYVCQVTRDRIEYRGAIAFERPVATDAAGYLIPSGSATANAESGKPYPDSCGETLKSSAERTPS
jgi:hypothetical protein